MSNVYYTSINNNTSQDEIKKISRELLEMLIDKEKITLEKTIPLKVHFGEHGNVTYLKPETYDGIIDFLEDKNIASNFIESSVLYGGKRYKKELHLETAKAHGFTRLPVIVADGDHGEAFVNVETNTPHFTSCKIGKEFRAYKQIIVCSHFKGHMLAGFGGAIKQLSMGFASKGGKLAMHMGVKPYIINRKCKQCNLCKTRCNENAITIGKKSSIDHSLCVGCGACISICPHKAVSIFSLKGILSFLKINNPFIEKVVEYAYAAHKDNNHIYINYAKQITPGCDCEPRKMKPVINDFGIFISRDPVAIDKACCDMAKINGKKFKAGKTFDYAEKIGLGTQKYTLINNMETKRS